jgi:hypothetical protein
MRILSAFRRIVLIKIMSAAMVAALAAGAPAAGFVLARRDEMFAGGAFSPGEIVKGQTIASVRPQVRHFPHRTAIRAFVL